MTVQVKEQLIPIVSIKDYDADLIHQLLESEMLEVSNRHSEAIGRAIEQIESWELSRQVEDAFLGLLTESIEIAFLKGLEVGVNPRRVFMLPQVGFFTFGGNGDAA